LPFIALLFWSCSADSNALGGPSGPLPYATVGSRLGVWDGTRHRPLFIKGINLGVAVPGTLAGELAATREQYDRWLEQIGSMGFNAIRVYTLHYPRFYDALEEYNRAHLDAPIYVLHGIWLDEENPSHDFFDMTTAFDAGIRQVIDCAHGRNLIPERKGRAFGNYRTDMSRWIIGWIIGREISPAEVATTNQLHPEYSSYQGKAISLPQGSPLESWLAERLDGLVLYERKLYGVERPISVSSWPTLDPLQHPSERMGSAEDSETIDLENIDTSHAKGGYFASYHAYPYYPDFMTRDEAYLSASDEQGPNTYVGYLTALKAHYANHPLLVAEFGVPTSWGNAHFGAGGMNHGGEDELQQGNDAARLIRNTLETDCAGGAFFAWIDEWWKRTWIVDELAMPRDRYRLWHNITSPEQNFGLIEFKLPDPKYTRWPKLTGTGRIAEIQADADAEYFHVRVKLDHALEDGGALTIGFDTYGDGVGESLLPSRMSTQRRNEFALEITPDDAQLYVMAAYDLFGIWHLTSTDSQLYHSIASDSGDWVTVRWRNNLLPTTPTSADDIDEIGRLVVRRAGAASDIRDGVVLDGATIEVRLPWTLLQFADPSTRSVIDDDRATPARETTVSDGIALSVQLGDELLETNRFRWEGWEEAPTTKETLKRSAKIFASGLKALQE
jgi:hypothetical protein